MSFKSFLIDFKKILRLYSLLVLLEMVSMLALSIIITITGLSFMLPFIFLLFFSLISFISIISFVGIQVYIYYEFEKRLIKKVYNPEFTNNKNIIIFIAVVSISKFVLLSMVNIFTSLMPFIEINRLTIMLFYSIAYIAFIYLYTYLLFDIKKFSKNILISLSFFLISVVFTLLLIGVGFGIILSLRGAFNFLYSLGLILFIFILIILIFFVSLIFIMSFYKTLYVQLVKYFKGNNKIEG